MSLMALLWKLLVGLLEEFSGGPYSCEELVQLVFWIEFPLMCHGDVDHETWKMALLNEVRQLPGVPVQQHS